MRIPSPRTLFTAAICALSISCADAAVKHILERGESLESIASKYGVTTEQIIELNPEAASFTYIGMELTIPETGNAAPTTTPAQATESGSEPAPKWEYTHSAPGTTDPTPDAGYSTKSATHRTSGTAYPEDRTATDTHNVFSMAALVTWQYNLSGEGGDFKTRSMYGIMAEGCTEVATNIGVGLSFGFRANYGLMPKDMGVLNGFLGPTLAIAFGESKTAGIYLPVCVGMTTDPRPKHDGTQWSCVILPHFAFSLSRVRINAGCGIDTDFSNTSVGLSIGLGYEF